MLKEETRGFFKKVHPLDLLPGEDLEALLEEAVLEYFPRDVRILTHGGAPAEYLYLVKKGGVRVSVAPEARKWTSGAPEARQRGTSADGEDAIVLDDRSEEDFFGFISLITGEAPRATIVALEDTICYLVPKAGLLAVLERNPQVNERLLKSYLVHFIDRAYLETRKKYAGHALGQRTLLATRLGSVVRRAPVTAPVAATIREAARRMAEHRISSVIVVGEGGEPMGIVTDRDLRVKVVATGIELGTGLGEIMSSPLIGIEAEEHCFEALLEMMRRGVHHLAVLEQGRLRGVVTHHDLMVLQGASPAVLVKEMAKLRSLDDLGGAATRLRKTVSNLVAEGAEPRDVSRTITELAERYVNRVIDLGERELGAAPLPYSLFLLGDGGRRELLLDGRLELGAATDETEDPRARGRTREYFAELRKLLGEARRASVGVVDARLPDERVRSFSGWRRTFEEWAAEPPPDLRAGRFLDLRPIRGDPRAVESLRLLLLRRSAAGGMIGRLVAETVANRPPLGFFRRFLVARSGEHRNELDLCRKGIRPLVEVVRILALEKGIEALSTRDRLRQLRAGTFPQGEKIEQAFDYVAALILHHQLAEIDGGEEPDSFLVLEDLAPVEKKTLKEAFQLTAELYERLERILPGTAS